MDVAELGHDAGALAAALRADPAANPRAAAQAATRLRETRPHLDDAAREQLARVLRLPCSLVEVWLDDTLVKLQAGAGDHAQVLERLEALAWAWGEVPGSWPGEAEQRVRADWRAS